MESGLEASNQKSVGTNATKENASWPPPRSAYIHVPFCRHRCGYCNFTLVAGRDDLVEPYLNALDEELRALQGPREVDTLFLGGGTPTHLRGRQLQRLLESVLSWHPLAKDHEFSVEANPSDIDANTVAILAEYRVTRISLGAQSFATEKLQRLERDHQPEQIAKAVELIRAGGMDVSLDLIFGVPGETLENWGKDLRRALQLTPDHISTYGLTFERGTTFWNRLQHGELGRVDEELELQMYAAAMDALTAAGFEHYEVSNFARPRRRCRHNEAYWTGQGYFAAGPGAARYIDGLREINHRGVATWLRRIQSGQSPVAESERLPPKDRAPALLVFGLRRLQGVDRTWFAAQTGYELDALVGRQLKRFVAAGMLADDSRIVRLTREGLFVSDSLWPEFL